MCNYTQSEKIRKSSDKCLLGKLVLINKSDGSNKDALLVTISNMFIATLWNAISTEYDAQVIAIQIHCIDEVGKNI